MQQPGVLRSVTMSDDHDREVKRAVDGRESQNYECSCCARSKSDSMIHWLQVELNGNYLIQTIRVLGRNDSTLILISNLIVELGS